MTDWSVRLDALVSPSAPISVIPAAIHQTTDLLLMDEPAWQGPVPDWQGVPCRIARAVMIWPVPAEYTTRRFKLLVLLPQADPPHLIAHVKYVHLGMQFFVEHDARLVLESAGGRVQGSLTAL
jgi:hypothetical protein